MNEYLDAFKYRVSDDGKQALPLFLCALIGVAVIATYCISFGRFIVEWLVGGIPLSNFGAKKGAWAVVTGATAGIGLEFADQLAKAGFKVLLVSRDAQKLELAAKEIEGKYKVETQSHAFDFLNATSEDWDKLSQKLSPMKVGVLVNNVGKSHDYPEYFAQTPKAECDAILKINIDSLVNMTRLVVPGMTQRKNGLILNIGSFSAWLPSPLLSVYSGSKSFVATFSQALGSELKDEGITVSLINTYFVVSNLSKIRKPSLFIPMPKAYVKSVLSHIGCQVGAAGSMPFMSTPYLGHAIVQYFVDRVGTWQMWFWYNKNLHVTVRDKALKKKARAQKAT